ncbi:hypothetical protein L9F63_004416 [Diploptera punctata]|uniref:Membrane insertase YidC/Oxa/ALB C-terminal domain-containing protein n=1 Tax=Diploptera punctata TaxID=6984 RepID=A0AAD8E7F1_DIPPU|nr:hypothetical protein L9F63_004416 [Diploptera punctata]
MATVGSRCNVTCLKYRNAVGILGYLKHDGIVKLESVRFHHIRSDLWRSYTRCFQHKKLYSAIQKNGFGDYNCKSSQHRCNIPEPPPVPPEITQQVVENVVGEPTFASLGLGGWSPVGLVQNCLEYLHIGCDIPWWTSIMIGTVVVRILMFPLVIMSQRNAAKMTNNMPQMQTLQLKMTEARQTGNQLEAARYGQELVLFMREKQLNPLKNVLVPLAQAPLFISFFMGFERYGKCSSRKYEDRWSVLVHRLDCS